MNIDVNKQVKQLIYNGTPLILAGSDTDDGAYDVVITEHLDGTQSLNIVDAGGDEITLAAKTITQNGTYIAADEGVEGYSEIVVDVAGSGEKLIPKKGFVIEELDAAGEIISGTWYGETVYSNSCTGTSLTYAADILTPYHELENINFADDVIRIGDYAFAHCIFLAITSLPETVWLIGNYAFNKCYKLALTSLPESLAQIGAYAFANTDISLTSLPPNLEDIPTYGFGYCKKLAITSIPASVNSIEAGAFAECTGLTNLTFEKTPYIDDHAFRDCTGLTSITFKTYTTGFDGISKYAFTGCTNLTTINVPWSEGEVSYAPWGATNATINYNYRG